MIDAGEEEGCVMRITDLVEVHENLFLADLEKCKRSGLKTYIYGAGVAGKSVAKRCSEAGFKITGMLVDREYYHGYQKGVFCLQDILESSKNKINLIVAFNGFDSKKLKPFEDKLQYVVDRDILFGNYDFNPEPVTIGYLKEHDEQLGKIYESLSDDL